MLMLEFVKISKRQGGNDMSKLLRGITIALAAGFAVLAPAAGLAQTKPSVTSLGPDYPKTAMFIGNSFFYYNNGMPSHVTLLQKAADPEHGKDFRNTMVTIGGSGFDWHDVENYFRPNAIGSTTSTSTRPASCTTLPS